MTSRKDDVSFASAVKTELAKANTDAGLKAIAQAAFKADGVLYVSSEREAKVAREGSADVRVIVLGALPPYRAALPFFAPSVVARLANTIDLYVDARPTLVEDLQPLADDLAGHVREGAKAVRGILNALAERI